MTKMERIKIDDLQLRPEVSSARLERRAKLRDVIADGMPDHRTGRRPSYDLDEYYDKALSLVDFRPGPRRLRSGRAKRPRCASATARTRSARAACWPAGWSKPARAFVEVNWPKVAN